MINGGFGLVLDGSADAARRASAFLRWDVCNGIARRAWAGNSNANLAIGREMERDPALNVTVAHAAEDSVLDQVLAKHF